MPRTFVPCPGHVSHALLYHEGGSARQLPRVLTASTLTSYPNIEFHYALVLY